MRTLLPTLILVLLISLATWMIPAWWWMMLLPLLFFIVFPGSVHKSAAIGFTSGLLVWGGNAIFQFIRESEVIAERVATLFSLPNGLTLVLVVGLFGGIIASLAAATGASIRSLFEKPKRRKIEYY